MLTLAHPDELLIRLGIASDHGRMEHARSAVEGATALIEGYLGFKLAQSTRTDYFNNTEGGAFGRKSWSFLCSQQFITSIDSVHASKNGVRLQNPTDGDTVDAKDYRVEMDWGVLNYHLSLPRGADILAITYTAGFVDDNAGVYAGTPEWMKEACIAMGVSVLKTQNTMHLKAKYSDVRKEMRSQVSQLLNPYLRPRAYSIYFARTEVQP